jgi:lysosomal acid lipase/cholesteryl ester hydrolase
MAIAGPSKHLNTSRIQVYVGETPAGSSTRNLQHWQQGVLVDSFQKYDFGSEEKNVAHYGQAVPPLYDLSKLSIPTALFAGGHDYLADPKDVQKIVNEAPSDMIVLFDEVESYAHLDYTWGFDANVYVYAKVLDVISKYI